MVFVSLLRLPFLLQWKIHRYPSANTHTHAQRTHPFRVAASQTKKYVIHTFSPLSSSTFFILLHFPFSCPLTHTLSLSPSHFQLVLCRLICCVPCTNFYLFSLWIIELSSECAERQRRCRWRRQQQIIYYYRPCIPCAWPIRVMVFGFYKWDWRAQSKAKEEKNWKK